MVLQADKKLALMAVQGEIYDQLKDMRGHREVTLPIIDNGTSGNEKERRSEDCRRLFHKFIAFTLLSESSRRAQAGAKAG